MTDFRTTATAIKDLRAMMWDLDGCYALDRLYDAALAIHRAAEYAKADPARMAKLDKHLRKIAIEVACQFPTEPLTARQIEIIDIDARSKARREDANGRHDL